MRSGSKELFKGSMVKRGLLICWCNGETPFDTNSNWPTRLVNLRLNDCRISKFLHII